MCPASILTPIKSRPNLELVSGNCESWITKNRGACALTRAGGSLYTLELKSVCMEPDLSLAGFNLVPLSKIGTLLLASAMPLPISRSRTVLSHLGTVHCVVDAVTVQPTRFVDLNLSP